MFPLFLPVRKLSSSRSSTSRRDSLGSRFEARLWVGLLSRGRGSFCGEETRQRWSHRQFQLSGQHKPLPGCSPVFQSIIGISNKCSLPVSSSLLQLALLLWNFFNTSLVWILDPRLKKTVSTSSKVQEEKEWRKRVSQDWKFTLIWVWRSRNSDFDILTFLAKYLLPFPKTSKFLTWLWYRKSIRSFGFSATTRSNLDLYSEIFNDPFHNFSRMLRTSLLRLSFVFDLWLDL